MVVSYEARVDIAGASSDLPECWSLYFIGQCSAMAAFSLVNCQKSADGSIIHSVDIIFFYLFNRRRASSSLSTRGNNGCPISTPSFLELSPFRKYHCSNLNLSYTCIQLWDSGIKSANWVLKLVVVSLSAWPNTPCVHNHDTIRTQPHWSMVVVQG